MALTGLDVGSMPEWLIPASALSFAILTFIGGLGWKQANQFSEMKGAIYNKLEKVEANILDKLEYHERHDDQRFNEIRLTTDTKLKDLSDNIWLLRLRNAANNGVNLKDDSINDQRSNSPGGRS